MFVSCFLFLFPSSLQAQEIDFLVQGDTYTPAFYKGRSLWSNQSRVIIVAIPQIPGIQNTSNLFYKWSKNGVVLGGEQGINGIGQNSLAFTDSILGKPQNIELEVLTSDGVVLVSGTTAVTPRPPSLLVYEDNPLYGVLFHREAGAGYALRDREITFAAFPLFFSATTRFDSAIEYSWRTNTGGFEARNSVTYRTPEGASGSSSVTAEAEHRDKIIQSARKNFLVQFGN